MSTNLSFIVYEHVVLFRSINWKVYILTNARVITFSNILGQTLEIIPLGSKVKKHKFPDKKVAYVLLAEGKFTYPDVSTALFSEEEIAREFQTGSKEDIEEEEDEGKKKKKPKYEPIKGTIS